MVLEEPNETLSNGLTGYRIIYDTGRRQYCEIRFAVAGSGENQIELMLLFIAKSKLPVKEVLMALVDKIDPSKE